MNFFDRIKNLLINKKTQEKNTERYEEDEKILAFSYEETVQIHELASKIFFAITAFTPDNQDILEYKETLEKVKSKCDERGINYETNVELIFNDFLNKLQAVYNSEKKEPVNYNELKQIWEKGKFEFEFTNGDEENIWIYFCEFNYKDIMNPTKLRNSIKEKLEKCYEVLGEYCLDKDLGELNAIKREFNKLFENYNNLANDYSKKISEMVIKNDYEISDEDLKRYYEFLIIQPKLSEMSHNIYEIHQFMIQNITEKRLEKYSKDDIFMRKLQIIMEHDKKSHQYLFHGTQALEDSESISKSGLLMMREDLGSTTVKELTEEELLLYERRRYAYKYW